MNLIDLYLNPVESDPRINCIAKGARPLLLTRVCACVRVCVCVHKRTDFRRTISPEDGRVGYRYLAHAHVRVGGLSRALISFSHYIASGKEAQGSHTHTLVWVRERTDSRRTTSPEDGRV